MDFKGAIFDLDGVITDTAKMHAEAWKIIFDQFLESHNKKNFIPFDKQKDYLKYVDGKPRIKGTKDFLESRNIFLDLGKPSDLSSKKTLWGISNKKNLVFLKLLNKQKPNVYKHAVSLIKNLRKKEIKVAIISSSKNCKKILKTCNLTSLFDVIIDGKISEKIGLSGKPDPDIFLYASKKLKLNPEDCIIFEDAFSGIEAGKKGNFGLVIGISRNNNIHLKSAHLVIKNLKEISLSKLNKLFKKENEKNNWNLNYFYFIPEEEQLREALTTTGNGFMGTRGCFETQSNSKNHYPGCYIAGIYNTLKTKIGKKESINNSLVNCPNWLLIKIKINNDFIDPFKQEIIEYEKKLNFKKAILYHKIIFKDKESRITKITSERFSSMKNPHLSVIKFKITPLNYSGRISLQSLIDGNIKNNNVARYRGLKSKHLKIISVKKINSLLMLHARTNQSKYDLIFSVKNITNKHKDSKLIKSNELIGEEFIYFQKRNQVINLTKIVSVFTSRESTSPKKDSLNLLRKTGSQKSILQSHLKQWKNLWKKSDLFIKGDLFSQNALRFHTYHLLSTYSPNIIGLDVSIPARGLTGESYHGHIFWDEIYIIPFFNHHFPELSKESLIYRYNRLKQAQQYAKKNGHKGAMYPWQSADTGKEETQEIHLNPIDNSWGPDFSRHQRHVSIAIFYNFYKYIYHAKDFKFLEDYGAEVMIEIARFWQSIAEYEKKIDKYHIKGVVGPDEFHEKYPWSNKPGFIDNAYTNVMVSWLLQKTAVLTEKLPQKLIKKLNLTKEEINKWKDVSKKINVVVKNEIIMQFKDFDKLKKINFEKYKKKYSNIERMDRILKAEGKSPNEYKVIKQPDVLMIFYVLEFQEVIKILRKLGINIKKPKNFIKKNYDYYASITTHGSTLSKFIHNAILSNLKQENHMVWKWFKNALESDIYDSQRGTTKEGIHCGLMAGTIEIVRKYFAGIKTHKKGLSLKPWLPAHWKKLKLRIEHQKKQYLFDFALEEKKLKIIFEKGTGKSSIEYQRKKYPLKKSKTESIKLKKCNF